MKRGLRLRWQLTFSHLAAVAVTLVSMIAAMVLLATFVLAPHFNGRQQPVDDARSVAAAIQGLGGSPNPAELNGALRVLASNRPGPPYGRPPWFGSAGPGLANVSYLALVGPDGDELASSDPAGAAFSPPERGAWAPLADKALAGDTTPADLMATPPSGPATLAAYPVLDQAGRPRAAVILAAGALPPASRFGFAQAVAFFGAASLAALLAASVFALGSSSLVAYLLARRVVRRLEDLGQAAEALAAGNLAARVENTEGDELGQLAQRFNQMAADLHRSLTDLKEERDRVTGLLTSRRELVASVSHELRTPVATIRGYLESALARDGHIAGELRGDLETVEAEVRRLQRLIDDLFTLSRADVGRLELRLAPTDVGSVLDRTVDALGPLAWQQRRVQIVASAPGDIAPATADAERLQQVLTNLVGNAVRHTPPGGLVSAAAGIEDGVVRLDVRDTGAGIDPRDLPHIFEPFYRGRNEDGAGGAGLGLAVSKELVEAMGGRMDVESAVGQGSCFTLRLPRA